MEVVVITTNYGSVIVDLKTRKEVVETPTIDEAYSICKELGYRVS